MSSPASRRRQRQRRRAQQRLCAIQSTLTDRQVDLASYNRVIADMDKRYKAGDLSPFSGAQALSIVKVLLDAIKTECDQLMADITAQEVACKKLQPEAESLVP